MPVSDTQPQHGGVFLCVLGTRGGLWQWQWQWQWYVWRQHGAVRVPRVHERSQPIQLSRTKSPVTAVLNNNPQYSSGYTVSYYGIVYSQCCPGLLGLRPQLINNQHAESPTNRHSSWGRTNWYASSLPSSSTQPVLPTNSGWSPFGGLVQLQRQGSTLNLRDSEVSGSRWTR